MIEANQQTRTAGSGPFCHGCGATVKLYLENLCFDCAMELPIGKAHAAEVHIQGNPSPQVEAAITPIMKAAYAKLPSRPAFLHPPSDCRLNGCPDCDEKVSER